MIVLQAKPIIGSLNKALFLLKKKSQKDIECTYTFKSDISTIYSGGGTGGGLGGLTPLRVLGSAAIDHRFRGT
jgi:hypothetical protein